MPARSKNDEHLITFHPGPSFNLAYICQILFQLFQNSRTQLAVSHLSTSKPDSGFYLVATLQPLASLLHAMLVVMVVGSRTKLNFPNRDRYLLYLGLVRLLLCFVLILSEIDDSTHGGIGIRSNFNQV